MMKSAAFRTMSAVVLAGSVALGASACTSVSSSGGSKSSGGSGGGSSAAPSSNAGGGNSSGMGGSSDTSSASSSDTGSGDAGAGSADGGEGLKTGKVGQEVSTSYYKAEVTKITDNAKSSDEFETPKSGTRFVDANVSVTNTGKDKLSMSDGDLEAQLSDDTQIEGSYTSGIGSEIGFKDLYTNDKISGDIVFEVPQGKQIKTLTFKPISIQRSGNDEEVRITVK